MGSYDYLTPEERQKRIIEILAEGVCNLWREKRALKHERQRWDRLALQWLTWDAFMESWLGPVGDAMLATGTLKGGHRVLDLGCGTGGLGQGIAARHPGIEVVGVDFSQEMVRIARQKAAARRLTNYKAVVGEASELPFEKESFDVILARHTIPFFRMAYTMKNVSDVLKPKGSMAISSWGPLDHNPWMAIAKEAAATAGGFLWGSGGPGPLRYNDPKELRAQIWAADVGCKHGPTEITGEVSFESPEHYWRSLAGVGGASIESPGEGADRMKEAVLAAAEKNIRDGRLVFGWSAWVAGGIKSRKRESPLRLKVRIFDPDGNEVILPPEAESEKKTA